MTDQRHPITPPPELVQQWWEEADQYQDDPKTYFDYVATEAAQWGADQELEACCKELMDRDFMAGPSDLRAARRPKPPSLKEQALEAQQRLMTGAWRAEDWQLISRALEALPND
jgi:hypothetical protein